ncbi:MAG: pilus assembly protein PilM [Candidatus Pacebacteria bacterium]|nr:pilus assembly protein PilM [Candidatus Paceibacterota bacterium]
MNLSKIFPIPKYLTLSAVGLDISDRSIRILGFKDTRSGLEVTMYGQEYLDEGVLLQGKIINPDVLKKYLLKMKSQYNFKHVCVSLSEEQVYLFNLEIPKMEVSEIRTSIELQLEDHILISSAESYMDYNIIGQTSKTYLLQVAAIPMEIVNQYFSIFEAVGIVPISFELESQAIARALVKRGDKTTYMIVDYGSSRTGISFVQGGIVLYATTVPLGGIDQTNKIKEVMGITYEEAEKMKKANGLTVTNGGVYEIILPSVSALRSEIYKHFIYWNTHKEGAGADHQPVSKILLCGGTSNLPGLVDYLSTSMQMPVELANVWANITNFSDYIPPISHDESLAYATVIGLATSHIYD